jgi:hypothetical protein
MFRLYLSHLQAFKGQHHTVSEQCIVGSPMLTITTLACVSECVIIRVWHCSLRRFSELWTSTWVELRFAVESVAVTRIVDSRIRHFPRM